MTDKDAMKLALDALETEVSIDWTNNDEFNASAEKMHHAIAALKERLTQPEQEPVGSVVRWVDGSLIHGWFGEPPPEGTLLYTHPPQRTEQETDELQSLRQFRDAAFLAHPNIDLDIEAAHGIKEDT